MTQEITPQIIDTQKIDEVNAIAVNPEAYKEQLKQLPEVKALTNEIDINNVNSIVSFGQKSADEISKISDEILNITKVPTNKDAAEMMTKLARVMNQFDINELKKISEGSPEEKKGFVSRMLSKLKDEFDAIVAKYDNMGKEVDKISTLLKQYEVQTQQSNVVLTRMAEANVNYFQQLEKYIAASEIGLQEIENYKATIPARTDMSEDEKQMHIQQVDMMHQMLEQRKYDLFQAEMVARMTVPMLNTMQLANVNLIREINSAFIVGLPIFKQNLAQAIHLKQQAIVANSVGQFKDAVNKQLVQNAQYAAAQNAAIAERTAGGTFSIETLESVYNTIKNGNANAQRIMQEQMQQNAENTRKLETLKAEIKGGSLN